MWKSITKLGILSILLIGLTGPVTSCSSTKNMHTWQDLEHAKQLDHKKGNRSKHIQKHGVKHHRRYRK